MRVEIMNMNSIDGNQQLKDSPFTQCYDKEMCLCYVTYVYCI